MPRGHAGGRGGQPRGRARHHHLFVCEQRLGALGLGLVEVDLVFQGLAAQVLFLLQQVCHARQRDQGPADVVGLHLGQLLAQQRGNGWAQGGVEVDEAAGGGAVELLGHGAGREDLACAQLAPQGVGLDAALVVGGGVGDVQAFGPIGLQVGGGGGNADPDGRGLVTTSSGWAKTPTM